MNSLRSVLVGQGDGAEAAEPGDEAGPHDVGERVAFQGSAHPGRQGVEADVDTRKVRFEV